MIKMIKILVIIGDKLQEIGKNLANNTQVLPYLNREGVKVMEIGKILRSIGDRITEIEYD